MKTKLLKIKLSHCGPTCSHYWLYSTGPMCCPPDDGPKDIPEEFDMKKGFPDFCKLEDVE